MKRFWKTLAMTLGAAMLSSSARAATDLVLYASGGSSNGNWTVTADSTAAGGKRLASRDDGWASPDQALASPADYFELPFQADANTAYTVWLRLKAGSNSKYNDSVYAQFSDAVNSSGSAIYRIGTSNALTVNLQTCAGCSMSGWGWANAAYWLSQSTVVRFATSGTHTIRVQTREDGVSIDQIALTASTSAPGSASNDATILEGAVATAGGTLNGPAPVPGTIQGADYNTGGEGVGYHDTTAGNAGGAYRSDSVDIESSADGGYNVGWTAAGEWLNYSVNVAAAGSYTAQLRVASPNGGTLHLGFNGASNVWTAITVPATGGWQSWSNISIPVTLGGGSQLMTLLFDTGGVNLRYVKLASGSTTSTTPVSTTTSTAASSGPYGGSAAAVPGTVSMANFDMGGEGVAYHDTTAGNAGGAFRSTDVDIEPSAEGGYDLGWVAAGEWANYTVNVGSSGSYTAQVRVASPTGGSLHIGFNGPSSVWSAVSVPGTGGYQSWATVNVPVTLGAGPQVMTMFFDTGGFNIAYVKLVAGTSASTPTSSSSGSAATVTLANWNVQIDDDSSNHARVAMGLLLSLGPRPKIITIQEGHKSQYNSYLDELQNQTGQTWYGTFRTHCPQGAWNGSSCSSSEDEGVGIFSSYPMIDTEYMYLDGDAWHSARAAVRAALNINGMTVQVFSVHLQPDNEPARRNSMKKLRTWAAQYGGAKLIGGDFNAGEDEVNASTGMGGAFVDTWTAAGSGNYFSAFLPSPSMKIDFVMSDSGGKATATSAYVPTSTGSWSDHRPVQATFSIVP